MENIFTNHTDFFITHQRKKHRITKNHKNYLNSWIEWITDKQLPGNKIEFTRYAVKNTLIQKFNFTNWAKHRWESYNTTPKETRINTKSFLMIYIKIHQLLLLRHYTYWIRFLMEYHTKSSIPNCVKKV